MSAAPESAEALGLTCLAWLIADEELLGVFMGATGAGAEDLRTGARDAAFLASVLDFLLMDDAWVRAFCTAHDLPCDAPMRARAALPGGAEVHWT